MLLITVLQTQNDSLIIPITEKDSVAVVTKTQSEPHPCRPCLGRAGTGSGYVPAGSAPDWQQTRYDHKDPGEKVNPGYSTCCKKGEAT